MTHSTLRTFFSGAVDALRSGYVQSAGSSSSSAGGLREARLRKVIKQILPPNVSVHHGDIIDAAEHASGQLDGVLVHPFGTSLKVDEDDPGVILAESAIAVLESKSTLTSQWSEVLEKARKVASLQRQYQGFNVYFGSIPVAPNRIPLHVIGNVGWQKAETLAAKVQELAACYPADDVPLVTVVQLSPPGIAYHQGPNGKPPFGANISPEVHRWDPLMRLCFLLTDASRTVLMSSPAWEKYLKYDAPLESE